MDRQFNKTTVIEEKADLLSALTGADRGECMEVLKEQKAQGII